MSLVTPLRGRKDNGAIWIVDAHREDRKRLVVLGDEILTAFLELGSAESGRVKVTITLLFRCGAAAAIRKNGIDIVHRRLA